jgi:endonuclease/exonuclease/phosphatase family metal-dependent hydrolase
VREAAPVRLVSFNVHHGTVAKKGPVDPDQLGEVCAGFDADVICLQEVDLGTVRVRGRDLAGIVARACEMDHVFGSSQRLLGGRYGNAVLVRGEIVGSTVTRLPKVPASRFWQEQRTVLEVDAALADGRLHVAATHLAVKQWNNGPQLEFLLRRMRDRPRPLAVLGDLNRRRAAVAGLAADAGLHTVEHGPTYPAWAPRTDIDHVLLSPELRPIAAEVRPTPMSDHAALLVDVERR